MNCDLPFLSCEMLIKSYLKVNPNLRIFSAENVKSMKIKTIVNQEESSLERGISKLYSKTNMQIININDVDGKN